MNCTGMYLVSLENSFQKTQIIKGFFTETISVLSRLKTLLLAQLVRAICYKIMLSLPIILQFLLLASNRSIPFFPMHFEMSKVCSNLCYPKSQKTLQISILNAFYEYYCIGM